MGQNRKNVLSCYSKFLVAVMVNSNMSTWLNDVKIALRNLGGEGHLSSIYKEVVKVRKGKLNSTFESTIRRELETNSSDSTAFIKKSGNDFFYMKGKGVWGLRQKRNFWFVSQSQTYKFERSGGYLWAPYTNKRGSKQFHYDTMGMVKKGDIIFSNYKGTIPAISEAIDKAEENSKIPSEFEKRYPWKSNGRKLKVKYLDIKPIKLTKEIREKLNTFKGNEEWILDKNLNTVVRYLLPLPNKAAQFFLKLGNLEISDIQNFNEEIEISFEDTKNKKKSRKGGQGFGLSAAEKKVVEQYAMKKVEKIWIKDGWNIEDVSMIKGGCDFKFSKNNKTVFCEVKGTTTNGDSIILTSREVDKMKERYPNCALYVVYGIRLDKSKIKPIASLGRIKKKYPWQIKDNKLRAKDYYYDF